VGVGRVEKEGPGVPLRMHGVWGLGASFLSFVQAVRSRKDRWKGLDDLLQGPFAPFVVGTISAKPFFGGVHERPQAHLIQAPTACRTERTA